MVYPKRLSTSQAIKPARGYNILRPGSRGGTCAGRVRPAHRPAADDSEPAELNPGDRIGQIFPLEKFSSSFFVKHFRTIVHEVPPLIWSYPPGRWARQKCQAGRVKTGRG